MFLCIPWDTVWAAVTALATVGLLICAYEQLSDLNKTSKEEFLHKLKLDFFTDNARTLLALLEFRMLEFEISELDNGENVGYFKIKKIDATMPIIKEILPKDKSVYSSYEMDDFLLSHLEDLGLLYKKGIVTINDVNELFGYYVESLFSNDQVKAYIDFVRKDDMSIYSNFENLYNELIRVYK